MKIIRKKFFIFKNALDAVTRHFSTVSSRAALMDRGTVLRRVPLELMKCLEMSDSRDTSHWIEKAWTLLDSSNKFYPPQVVLLISAADDFYDLRGAVGTNEIKKLIEDYKTPDNFIEQVRYQMLTETKEDSPKYEKHFKIHGTQVTNDGFKYFSKFAALCLSGQLTIESCDDFWSADIMKFVETENVDCRKTSYRLKADIVQILSAVLYGYTGNKKFKSY